MTDHTPHDSLLFLDSAASLLSWCDEELAGIHNETPDLEAVGSALYSFQQMIRAEVEAHGGHRNYYSTGVPVHVRTQEPGVEPDPDTGLDTIVTKTYVRTCYPDGTLDHPNTREAS